MVADGESRKRRTVTECYINPQHQKLEFIVRATLIIY
jgi:hypothetical protein